jgi:hypothetical protein
MLKIYHISIINPMYNDIIKAVRIRKKVISYGKTASVCK